MNETNMDEKPFKLLFKPLAYVVFCFFLFSCKTQKQVQYLQTGIDSIAMAKIYIPEPTIQRGDVIGMTIFSDNPGATAPFNQSVQEESNTLSTSVSLPMPQYLVDNLGNIQIYTLGAINVEGLTRTQLGALLTEKLSPYLKNPYCSIRFLNQKFTILGEVTRQGVYSISGENMNVFQALGVAGDLTLYGLKDSILVMREFDGKRSFGYLDVSDANVINSPYFYLKQNDVIMVRANPKKPAVSDQATLRTLTIAASVASILVSITLVVSRFLN